VDYSVRAIAGASLMNEKCEREMLRSSSRLRHPSISTVPPNP
jgi:hypothetical protein